jgi:hypothetical protein
LNYSALLSAMRLDAEGASIDVTEDWLQGRSAFGGLQSAVAVKAMRALVPAAMPLRTLQTTFIAPIAGTIRVRATVLRAGKNTIHVEARLFDGDDTAAIVIGVFGTARASVVARLPVQVSVTSDKPIALRYTAGIMPAFLQHFDARWFRGGAPYSGSTVPEMVVELGMRDDGTCSEAHAIAIADFIPPVALAMLKTPAPGSSLTWMLEFLVDRFDDLALSGWRVDAEMIAARDGYTNQSTMVWGPNGVPVALSRQSMVVFG